MNPLLEKYEELYGPKVEDQPEEQSELPEGYLYRHCATGNYVGDTTYDAINCHKIRWNGKYWEKFGDADFLSGNSYIGTASSDTICLGTPFPSAGYGVDHLTLSSPSSTITSTTSYNQPVVSSLSIDGKDIKDVIEEEVKKQLHKHHLLDKQIEEIKDNQLKSVAKLLKRVLDGHVTVKSYSEQISYDLGGSITYYDVKLEGS